MLFRALLPNVVRNLTGSIREGLHRSVGNGRIERQLVSKRNYGTSPKLRQAELSDYGQIAAIQNRNGLGTRAYENWLEFWLNNPAYKRYSGSWPIGWVLQNSDSKIVGWLGNFPSAYHFAGKELVCATASPWVVDEPYRGYSMVLLDRFTRQTDVDLLVNSTVGSTAGLVSNLFGYSKVPVGIWDRSAFWITNYPEFLCITLSMKRVPMARNFGYLFGAALFLRDYFKGERAKVYCSCPPVQECSQFDNRFDDFWERLKQDRSDTLLAVRSQDTLEWHFRDQLARRQLWIFTVCEGSRIVAVAILDRRDNAGGLKCVRLVDFQTLRGWEQALHPFLARALEKCRTEGMHSLEVTGCWLDRPGLPRVVPPRYRRLPSWIFYYKALDQQLFKALRKPTTWAPSSYDGDSSV